MNESQIQTADHAENRRLIMARKNWKMTEAERAMHDRAVSLRKMTDKQLCETMDRQHSTGIDEGLAMAKEELKKATRDDTAVVKSFIDYLESKVGCGNGIGNGTIIRLNKEVENAVKDGVLGDGKWA